MSTVYFHEKEYLDKNVTIACFACLRRDIFKPTEGLLVIRSVMEINENYAHTEIDCETSEN